MEFSDPHTYTNSNFGGLIRGVDDRSRNKQLIGRAYGHIHLRSLSFGIVFHTASGTLLSGKTDHNGTFSPKDVDTVVEVYFWVMEIQLRGGPE